MLLLMKVCPFNAIQIINLPSNLDKETTHRYGPNSFKLHRYTNISQVYDIQSPIMFLSYVKSFVCHYCRCSYWLLSTRDIVGTYCIYNYLLLSFVGFLFQNLGKFWGWWGQMVLGNQLRFKYWLGFLNPTWVNSQ